jgi:hypothetical protein
VAKNVAKNVTKNVAKLRQKCGKIVAKMWQKDGLGQMWQNWGKTSMLASVDNKQQ